MIICASYHRFICVYYGLFLTAAPEYQFIEIKSSLASFIFTLPPSLGICQSIIRQYLQNRLERIYKSQLQDLPI